MMKKLIEQYNAVNTNIFALVLILWSDIIKLVNELRTQVKKLMQNNRRRHGDWQYTVPSPRNYPYEWLWDSCFHAIILSHFNLRAAKAELRSLVAHQYKNGFISHVTYWEKQHNVLKVDWGLPHTSSLIQPPILALAVAKIFAKDRDLEFVEEIYPALEAFYDFIWQERRVSDTGLISIVNPDESGEDNSPRFDRALKLSPQHEVENNVEKRYALFDTYRDLGFNASKMKDFFAVEDSPFNALMAMNLEIMSRLAGTLNKPKKAKKFERKAWQLREAMRKHMLEDGVFCSLDTDTGAKIKAKTASAFFFPLSAGLYSQQEAVSVVKNHLLDEESFWLPAGVPTTAKDDPAFDPKEPSWGEPWQHPHWRGPVWMSIHWFIYHGLRKYGFEEEALCLKKKSVSLVERHGFHEYFNPLTGAGQGAKHFTWGGLVIDME